MMTIVASGALKGVVTVPGELAAALTATVLAALAEGETRIDNAPPGLDEFTNTLGQLGVDIERIAQLTVAVKGGGMRGLRPTSAVVDLSNAGPAAAILVAALTGHGGQWRIRPGETRDDCIATLAAMAPMGVSYADGEEGGPDSVLTVSAPDQLHAGAVVEQGQANIELALLVAGLYGEGDTTLTLPIRKLDRADQQLRAWSIEIAGSKGADGKRLVTITGGQQIQARQVEITGDLDLAAPLLTAAVSLKGSQVRIRNVVVRPHNRAYLDLLRQLGARIDFEEEGETGAVDLAITGSAQLKATRVADKRADRLLDKVPILAVLATQTDGQFLIRDVERLRAGAFDAIVHLAEALRRMEAKVGEFPEGLVIDGSHPLQGARLDTHGDADFAQAMAVAGLLANGETQINGADLAEENFPGFFDALTTLTEKGKRK